jgi:hypothetical protein
MTPEPPEPLSDTNSEANSEANSDASQTGLDANLTIAIDRLHRLTVWGRWVTVGVLWSTVGGWSLWQLRKTWDTLRDYFTWSAIRVGLIFHPIAALGLAFCIAMTLSVLLWQSRNILWGLPDTEQATLKARALKIQQQGRSHPLWKWVWEPD